jgi:hypothetical protein
MQSTFWTSLSPRRRKWLKRTAGLLAFYTLFGFLILPLIVKAVAVGQLKQQLKRETTIESVRLNPYAMSITIRGLNIKDLDAKTLLSWDEVYVNFRLFSVFSRAWGFDGIRVINPYVRVQLNKDMTFNFTDILESFATTNAPTKADAPRKTVPVALRHFLVEGARLEWTDLTPKNPFHRMVGPVKVELNNFHTDPNNRNPHVFTGTTETGETFRWGGTFSLEPVRAAGEFAVENVALKQLAPLYQDLVNFEIRDGVTAFGVNYLFEMTPTMTNAAVSNLTIKVKSLKVAQPGHAENLFELPEFSVSGVSGDLLTRNLTVDSVSVNGAALNVQRGADATFNVVAAATPITDASAPAGILLVLQTATNLISQLLTSTNLATAMVREISVTNCLLSYRDDACVPPARLVVDQINLTARNLSNRSGTNMTSNVSLRWNTNGSVAVGVTATLDPLQVDVDLDVQQLEFAPLDPYLRPHVNAYILGSKAGLDGRVHLAAVPGGLPEITFTGNASLDELRVLGNTSEDLLKWGSLRFAGIAANLHPPAVTVSNVTLKDLAARVVIESNRTINVFAVLPAGETNLAAPPESKAASAATGPGGIKGVFAQVKTVLGMNPDAVAAGLPKVEVDSVRVEDSSVLFLDRSVTPEARLSLQKIQVEIADISTEAMQRAKIRVSTLVGGTGPVEVTAELNPLQAKAATQAKVSVKNVQLRPTDPYVAKFLGYRLTRGSVNVDMDYTITASEVKGRNVIVVDQFTLGSKVQSPDAIGLPVKLGVALLKDSSGKINLDVPVEGNLDDPKFRIGKVVWGVVANMFVKAVTSPFSLLGGLVGGSAGEDMQFQEFVPGKTNLNPAAQQKLTELAKALDARPALQVVVEGNVDRELDGWALRQVKAEKQLQQMRWNSLRAAAREQVKPEDVDVPLEVRADLLEKAYRNLIATNQQLAFAAPPAGWALALTNSAAAIASPRRELEKGASRLMSDDWGKSAAPKPTAAGSTNASPETEVHSGRPTPEQMQDSLTAAQVLADADYAVLAAARAERVRSNLITELKVAAERVLIGEAETGSFGTNGHRVVLQLQ